MDKEWNISTENLSDELMFLIGLLNVNDGHLTEEKLDWDEVMDLARHHRIFPLLAPELKGHGDVPSDVQEQLNSMQQENTFRMLHLSAAMIELCRQLSEIGVPAIQLKGPVLARNLYGDISLRTSSDLDMLVPIEQLERTEAFLKDGGYIKDDYIDTVLGDWKWRHHHVTYIHPVRRIKMEVHWRLHPGPAKEPSFKELWARKCSVDWMGTAVHQLGKEDQLLFLLAHGARHGWSRLRWLIDIRQLMRQGMDWQLFRQLMERHGWQRTAGHGLLLANQILKAPINKELLFLTTHKATRQLAQQALFYLERKINLHSGTLPETVSQHHRRYLFAMMGIGRKITFLLSFLFPYPDDKRTLPLPNMLHFLYFPLRPFLWMWRKTRKYALSEAGK